MDKERRFFSGAVEVRESQDGNAMAIRGYAALFESLSENLGGFREQILPGAFSDVLENDVRALMNHDENIVLGRTTSKTLSISQDAHGLFYEVDLPDTQAARDLLTLIKRGDVTQSSFAFSVAAGGDSWAEDDEGRIVRTITKVGRLFDVSPVTYPAYPDTTVGARGLEEFKKSAAALRREAQQGYWNRKFRRVRLHELAGK